MTTTKELLAKFQKAYGEKIGGYGAALKESERVPTGFFAFDLATGGGFPRGRCSVIFGPESSGKTNLALRAIAHHQKVWPEQSCVFFDVENALEPDWARALGVDVDRLIVIKPEYAEQVVDMAESFLEAADVGMVVIDSIAALITTQEIDSSAEKANVGGSALVVGKLARKTTHALTLAEKEGRFPTLIYINQIRHKIGVMYGSPETQPGGFAFKFQAAMMVRCYGKNIVDNKVNKAMPCKKETTFSVIKWKVPIIAQQGVYEMVSMPHNGFEVGEVDDWNLVSGYLKDYGLLAKEKTGWRFDGQLYATLQLIREKARKDPMFAMHLRHLVVQAVMSEGLVETSTDAETVDDAA